MNANTRPEGRRGLGRVQGFLGWIVAGILGLGLLSVAGASRTPASAAAPAQTQEPPTYGTQSFPNTAGGATADSNDRMIAVTGVDVTGGTLLFLVDTQSRHLTVYQATGGTRSTMNLQWVGARNIDLDLQVDGWNDESEYSYKDLVKAFEDPDSVSLPD